MTGTFSSSLAVGRRTSAITTQAARTATTSATRRRSTALRVAASSVGWAFLPLYPLLFEHVLRRLDAESVHHRAMRGLALVGKAPPVLAALRRVLAPRDPALRVEAFGLS